MTFNNNLHFLICHMFDLFCYHPVHIDIFVTFACLHFTCVCARILDYFQVNQHVFFNLCCFLVDNDNFSEQCWRLPNLFRLLKHVKQNLRIGLSIYCQYVYLLTMMCWNIQGRVIPCDFIGVVKSQQPVYLKGMSLVHL